MAKLEEIAKDYGMVDYCSMSDGLIYQLSKAEEYSDNMLAVPMLDLATHELIGYALMEAVA